MRSIQPLGPRRWVWCVTGLALMSIALPSLANRLWVAELSVHFVAQYALAALALATLLVLRGYLLPAFVMVLVAGVQSVHLLPLWIEPSVSTAAGVPTRVTIAQVNVNIANRDPGRVVEWLVEQQPDIAVLVEVTDEWEAPLARLRSGWQRSLIQLAPDRSGVAVFSRDRGPVFRVESLGDEWCPAIVVNIPQAHGPAVLALFATHLRNPMTSDDLEARNRQLAILGRRVADEPASHKIVIGDLNVTRWSPWFGDLTRRAGLRDAQEGFGLGGSWPSPLGRWMGIPIDHTLVSSGIRVVARSVGPNLGSDHLPIITTIEFSRRIGADADDRDFAA